MYQIKPVALLFAAYSTISQAGSVPKDETGNTTTDIISSDLFSTAAESLEPLRNSTNTGFEKIVTTRHSPDRLDTDANLNLDIAGRKGKNITLLEVIYISSTAGYVQNRNWDGKSGYGGYLNAWAEVIVPDNCDVMLSFTHLQVEGAFSGKCTAGDSVSLYLGNSSDSALVWRACENFKPRPTLFVRMQKFLIRFKTDIGNVQRTLTGFRLHFSFHNSSSSPKKYDNGTWDCSGSLWPDLRPHFQCNLEQDCSDFRDEFGCSYTNALCGPGRLGAGGECFLYVDLRRLTSWTEAQRECYARGARLASLTIPEVWNGVIQILRGKFIHRIFVGLQTSTIILPDVYRNLFIWSDKTTAFYFHMDGWQDPSGCSILDVDFNKIELPVRKLCQNGLPYPILCRLEKETKDPVTPPHPMTLTSFNNWSSAISIVKCPGEHVTHTFLACESQCYGTGVFHHESCSVQLIPTPPSFLCNNGMQSVPYTLLCDHRADCNDRSDEEFCQHAECHWLLQYQCGGSRQCIPEKQVCDGHKQCITGTDEHECVKWNTMVKFYGTESPSIVNINSGLKLNVTTFNTSLDSPKDCPVSHFRCPSNGYCLPVFLRCNGIYDCPDRADETACDVYSCPGFYRCRASQVCVHPDNMCDGIAHCPKHDDEMVCHVQCPVGCVCYGLAFYCSTSFLPGIYPHLRFLQAVRSTLTVSDFKNNHYLVFLSLTRCGLKNLKGLALPNLLILNVADNLLTSVKTSEFEFVPNLRELILAGNPLSREFLVKDTPGFFTLPSLQSLDASRIIITELNTSILSVFPNLQSLNFSDCGIVRVVYGFSFLSQLRVLDLRGSPVTHFTGNLLASAPRLQSVYADNYRICCPATLPKGFNIFNCHAPVDEISSCDALLRSNFYRILLILLAASALSGNLGTFIFRTLFAPSSTLGFAVMVTHLCASDFLMGVYLMIIGIADGVYQGCYLWKEVEWRQSLACNVAGFLSLLSSEVSAFIICLITLDRLLVLRFPFKRICFTKKSANVACALAWGFGLLLATIPLLPQTSHWNFYSQTGICIPLPITRQDFSGHSYSFSVMIVLNFVLFILIAAGQFSIFWSIKTNSMASTSSNKQSKDLTIAQRLITIAVTDFLCWFPVGLLGLLASNNIPIPGEVNVALAIVALPLNSAINPFLYTLNTVLEQRRHVKEERLKKFFTMQLINTNVSSKRAQIDVSDFSVKRTSECRHQ